MPASDRPFSNYLVFKDDTPFLIVNATLENVRRLVERFGLGSEHSFSFRPYA